LSTKKEEKKYHIALGMFGDNASFIRAILKWKVTVIHSPQQRLELEKNSSELLTKGVKGEKVKLEESMKKGVKRKSANEYVGKSKRRKKHHQERRT